MLSNQKIAAIYDVREAVETKVLAEQVLDNEPSPDTRSALLDATLDLESKTQKAIDVCHECEIPHPADGAHGVQAPTGDNVISVNFRDRDERPT